MQGDSGQELEQGWGVGEQGSGWDPLINQESIRVAALPCPALPMQEAGGGGLATKALCPAGLGVTAWLGCRQQREASGWASPGQQPRCSSWAFPANSSSFRT